MEILKVNKTSYMVFQNKSEPRHTYRQPHATYSEKGKIIGYHWVVRREHLEKTIPGWEKYRR